MSTPDRPEASQDIADTGMFQRFVDHEQELAAADTGSNKGRWIGLIAIVLIVAVAITVWLLTR